MHRRPQLPDASRFARDRNLQMRHEVGYGYIEQIYFVASLREVGFEQASIVEASDL